MCGLESRRWSEVKECQSSSKKPVRFLEANQQRFPELDIDAAIEATVWEEVRHYRVAVTARDIHAGDVSRQALFKGFDKVAPGKRERRQAETLFIPDLRKWMSQFAKKTIRQIEAWRDNV